MTKPENNVLRSWRKERPQSRNEGSHWKMKKERKWILPGEPAALITSRFYSCETHSRLMTSTMTKE
jgi:hypothetical protein